MRFLFYILTVLVLLPAVSYGQSDALAEDYFKRGDYEKALLTYQKLYDNQRAVPSICSKL